MISSSFLTDPTTTLVIDASVAINLNATNRAAEIVSAFPGIVVVTQNAIDELDSGTRNGHIDAQLLRELVDRNLVAPVALGENSFGVYETLVGCGGFAAELGSHLLARCKGSAQERLPACSGTTQLADLPAERVIEPAQLSSQLLASLFRTCFWPAQGQNSFEQLSLTCTVLADDDVDARREVDGQLGEGGEVFELQVRDHAPPRR